MEDSNSAEAVLDLVADFCVHRDVATRTSFTLASSLDEAIRIIGVKGPDRRWRTVNTRGSAAGVPSTFEPASAAALQRRLLARAVSADQISHSRSARPTPNAPWYLRPIVVSSAHFARSSLSICRARTLGLGWILPANGEVLAVTMPNVVLAQGSSDVPHDDGGRPAVTWANGTTDYYLQGAWFTPDLYRSVIAGELTLSQVATLPNADQRSVALTYLTLSVLVGQSGALLMDHGSRGTRLYRLRLPISIAADRPVGYGPFDYFIHMHDASHPEREFIEWVDPVIGCRGDAEL